MRYWMRAGGRSRKHRNQQNVEDYFRRFDNSIARQLSTDLN